MQRNDYLFHTDYVTEYEYLQVIKGFTQLHILGRLGQHPLPCSKIPVIE